VADSLGVGLFVGFGYLIVNESLSANTSHQAEPGLTAISFPAGVNQRGKSLIVGRFQIASIIVPCDRTNPVPCP
jgi:hypothetical protein